MTGPRTEFVGSWPVADCVTRKGAVRRACACAHGTCERCLRKRREQTEPHATAAVAAHWAEYRAAKKAGAR